MQHKKLYLNNMCFYNQPGNISLDKVISLLSHCDKISPIYQLKFDGLLTAQSVPFKYLRRSIKNLKSLTGKYVKSLSFDFFNVYETYKTEICRGDFSKLRWDILDNEDDDANQLKQVYSQNYEEVRNKPIIVDYLKVESTHVQDLAKCLDFIIPKKSVKFTCDCMEFDYLGEWQKVIDKMQRKIG